jgi:prepilin-type processing-associated H-X9-DG protein
MGYRNPNPPAINGIFFPVIPPVGEPNSVLRIRDVLDGTSNTLMLGERPNTDDLYWGWWACGGGESDAFLDIYKGLFKGQANNPANQYQFWSWHPDGTQFAFADGSARLFRYNTSLPVCFALATRAGGETFQAP